MTALIHVKIDDKTVLDRLQKIASQAGSINQPLKVIGEMMRGSIVRNFEVGGRYSEAGSWRGGNRAWQKLDDATLTSRVGGVSKRFTIKGKTRAKAVRQIRDHKILVDRAILRNSIHAVTRGNSLYLGTNVPYAAAHNFGIDKIVSSTSSKGKSFKRRMKLPARPFMVVQDRDITQMLDVLDEHLMK